MPKHVTHLIVGLGKGGAETMLYQVLKYRTRKDIAYKIISLGASHYYETPIRQLGIPVVEAPLRKHPLKAFGMLLQEIRGSDTLCCWMYHSNLIGYYIGKLAGVKRIVWCIRHADFSREITKPRTLRINSCCAKLSRNVAIVTYNGELSRRLHEEHGYSRDNGVVLNNGCDVESYYPNPTANGDVRQEFAIPQEKRILLSVTKYATGKDIPTFLKAFSQLRKEWPDTVTLMCGGGLTPDNEQLIAQCRELGLSVGTDIFLLGMRHDVPRLMASCDLYVLHSSSEAFPNVLIQAMSCGCLCLTTDVGDARRILDNDHCIVPPGDASALANKMHELLKLPQSECEKLRGENRRTVQEKFEIRKIIRSYEELF